MEERLPEDGKPVLVCGGDVVTSGRLYRKSDLWVTHDEVDVAHWMPLPKAQEEE